jgi:hypothetical protein
MKKVRLNKKLISTLSSVTYIPGTSLMKFAGVRKSSWYNIRSNPDLLTVQQLLGIANGAHIPVRRFFTDEEEDTTGSRDDYIVRDYKPCSYNGEVIRDKVTGDADATWKKAAEATGMTPLHLRDSMLAVTRTPVDRLLAVCETFGIDPFTVLIDPNTPGKPKKKPIGTTGIGHEELLKEIECLRGDVRRLTEVVDKVTEKYKDLLEEHKALADRVRDYTGGDFATMAEPLLPTDPD